MGVKKCVYKECGLKYRADVEVSFHRFPNNQDLFARWLYAMRWKENWLPVRKQDCLCSAHFTNGCFTIGKDGFKKRLKMGSIPSIFDPAIFRPRQGLPVTPAEKQETQKQPETITILDSDETPFESVTLFDPDILLEFLQPLSQPATEPEPRPLVPSAATALQFHTYAQKKPYMPPPTNGKDGNNQDETFSTGSSSDDEDDEDDENDFRPSTSLPLSSGLKYCRSIGLGKDLEIYFTEQGSESTFVTPKPPTMDSLRARMKKFRDLSRKRRHVCAAQKLEIAMLKTRVCQLESKLKEIKKLVNSDFESA